MFRLILTLPLTLAFVTGCIEVPELEASVSDEAENADAPSLLPIGTAIATTTDPRLDGSEAEVLSRRAEALKAEAQGTGRPSNAQDLDEQARKLNLRADDLRNR